MTSLHPDIFGHEGGMPQRRLSGNVRGLDDGVIHPPAEPNFWTRVIAKAREWTGQTVETDTLRSAEEPTTASGHYRVAVVLVEFDGTAFYATAAASARQVLPAVQCQVLTADRAGTDVSTAQAVFDASTDAVTLAAAGRSSGETTAMT